MEQFEDILRNFMGIAALLSTYAGSSAARKEEWPRAISHVISAVGLLLFLIFLEVGEIEVVVNVNGDQAVSSSQPLLPTGL